MSVLEEYLARKGYTDSMIRRAEEEGRAVTWINAPPWERGGDAALDPSFLNYFVDNEMLFSHRCDRYTDVRDFLTSEFHAYGYYEITVNIRGDAEYIQNDRHIHTGPGTIVCCEPGSMHAFRQLSCEYERYLMYFSPKFFSWQDQKGGSILHFAENKSIVAFRAAGEHLRILLMQLERIRHTLGADLPYRNILAKALIVELFAFFNDGDLSRLESQNLNDPMADVKKFIDRRYADISSVDEIATEFHYSREHLSRTFKGRFYTSISKYLSRRRIAESTRLLTQMSITEAGYAVGFRSQSSYIAAFKKNMGCLPSRYKQQLLKE